MTRLLADAAPPAPTLSWTAGAIAPQVAEHSYLEYIQSVIPDNFLAPFLSANVLSVLLVSAAILAALTACSRKEEPTAASQAVDAAKDSAQHAVDAAKDATDKAATATSESAQEAAGEAKNAVDAAREATGEAVSKAADATKEAAEKATDAGREAVTEAADKAKAAVKK